MADRDRKALYVTLIILSLLAILPLVGMIGLTVTGPLLGEPGGPTPFWRMMGISEPIGCVALLWMTLVIMLLVSFIAFLSRQIRQR